MKETAVSQVLKTIIWIAGAMRVDTSPAKKGIAGSTNKKALDLVESFCTREAGRERRGLYARRVQISCLGAEK